MSKDLMSEVFSSVNRKDPTFNDIMNGTAAPNPAAASRARVRADGIVGRTAHTAGLALTWATWCALAWAYATVVDDAERLAVYATEFDRHVRTAVLLGGDRALPKPLQAKAALNFGRKAAKAHREKHWVPRNKDPMPQV